MRKSIENRGLNCIAELYLVAIWRSTSNRVMGASLSEER